MSHRRALEDAVVAAIKTQLVYLRAVAPYAGELGGTDMSDVFDRLRGRVPAVLVATGDSRIDTLIQSRHVVTDVELVLYLASGNMRSREDKLRSEDAAAGGGTGIYKIAEDTMALLLGRDVGISGVGRLNLISESSLVHREDLAIWRVRYSTRMDAVGPAYRPAQTILELAGNLNLSLAEDSAQTTVIRATNALP